MSTVQAVIFTHCARLEYKDTASFSEKEQSYIIGYQKSFEDFLQCNKDEIIVTDVFAYIDQGVRTQITQQSSQKFELNADIDEKEQILKSLLRVAERQARAALNLKSGDQPQFHYVGLRELTNLLNKLWKVDPSLLQPGIFLGNKKEFTYDSPKFVEAVIRLARGDIPHLAKAPIIRIDDDAKINSNSIKILLDEFESLSK